MFECSLMESGNKLKTKRLGTTILSFLLQVGLICILILIPLIYTDALPKGNLMTFLVAPPPPPPPPPPPAAAVKVVKIQSEVINGQLRTPTKIPSKVQMIKEEEAPPDLGAGGVPAGVPAGIPGGSTGGVMDAILVHALLEAAHQGGLKTGGNSAEFGFLESSGRSGRGFGSVQVFGKALCRWFSCRDAACRVSCHRVRRGKPRLYRGISERLET